MRPRPYFKVTYLCCRWTNTASVVQGNLSPVFTFGDVILNPMKNSYNYLAIILCFGITTLTAQQSFSELGEDFNDRSFRLFVRGTYVKPGADETYHAWTINGSLCMNDENILGTRVRYENPTLGDGIYLLVHTIRGKPWTTPSGLQHAYGAGWV